MASSGEMLMMRIGVTGHMNLIADTVTLVSGYCVRILST